MKKRKKILFIGTIYTLVVALLLSVVFLTTGAKYRSEIQGYTDYNIAEFSAIILDDISVSNLVSNTDVQNYGTNTLQLSDCYPGMPARDYSFVVANGTSISDCAGADIEFTIQVQSQRNIPLTYSLVYYYEDDEFQEADATVTVAESSGEAYQYPASQPTVVEIDDLNAKDDDATWYSYTFRTSYEDLEEQVFTLTGQKLHVMHFALRVEWPIITSENEEDVPTNSSVYMKEIEIINMVVSLNSKDKTQDPSYNKDDDDDYGTDKDYYAKGMLFLTPGLADGSYTTEGSHGYTIYTYDLDVDYRALKKDGTSNTYTYSFDVNNGNGIYKFDSQGERILSQTKKYVQYYIRVMIPYTEDTKDIVLNLSEGDSNYGVLSSEYRKYNIQYDVVKTVMDGEDEISLAYGEYVVVTQEEADEIISLDSSDPEQLERIEENAAFGYYRVDTYYLKTYVDNVEVPMDENTQAAYHYFINYNIGQTGYSRFSESSFTLTVEDDTGNEHNLAELQTEHANAEDDKEYTFTIIGEAIFSNRPNGWTTQDDLPDE